MSENKKQLDEAIKQTGIAKTRLHEKELEIAQLSKDLSVYAFISSHNLQEPLRNLQFITSLILDQEEKHLSNEGKQYFRRLRKSAQKIQNLLRDLLEYLNINKEYYKDEPVDLNLIVKNATKELSEQIHDSRAIIRSKNLCTINAKPIQIAQLIKDLLGNSIKFAKPGISPVITVKSETVKDRKLRRITKLRYESFCHIIVQDDGIGFEPSFNERVFNVFEKLNGDLYPGTGIGLAICKKIVENHGGYITASGNPEKGTIIDIYLPSKSIV